MTGAVMAELDRYRWASDFLTGLIQRPPSPPPDATAEEIRGRAVARLSRLRAFLEFAGNPQNRFRSVHVGGTSGKGSTSALIASVLSAAGYRTGLHVSPYLQVETEKLQIDGQLLSGSRFADHVIAVDRLQKRWMAEGGAPLTYGEFWVALTFLAFAEEAVEFAVIEVGAGGRFDLTNVLLPEVAVITSVGIDHVRTLGSTIPEIAWHKAGIIKRGRPVVTTAGDPEAVEVIAREAREQAAPLTHLVAGRDFTVQSSGATGTTVVDARRGRPFHVPLPGAFQGTNAAAAIAAVRALPDLPHGRIGDEVIAEGLTRARFPGRLEIVQERPQVVLDGAHNPEKMDSLVTSLRQMGPVDWRILVLGALDGHDYLTTASIVVPLADQVIVTAPYGIERQSARTEDIARVAQEAGRPVEIIPDPSQAVAAALRHARTRDQVLVTGSLYLVGAVRERWYPSDEIVVQRTSWPAPIGPTRHAQGLS